MFLFKTQGNVPPAAKVDGKAIPWEKLFPGPMYPWGIGDERSYFIIGRAVPPCDACAGARARTLRKRHRGVRDGYGMVSPPKTWRATGWLRYRKVTICGTRSGIGFLLVRGWGAGPDPGWPAGGDMGGERDGIPVFQRLTPIPISILHRISFLFPAVHSRLGIEVN